MNSRKLRGRLAPLLAGLALLLAGCGGGGKSSSGSTGGGNGNGSLAGSAAAQIKEFGSGAGRSETEQAEAALLGYLTARAAGEWSQACSYLAKSVRSLLGHIAVKSKRVKGKGCRGFIETSTEKLSPSERTDLTKVDVSSLRVEGERGYLLYKDAAGAEQATSMRSEGGRWKITSLLALPLSR